MSFHGDPVITKFFTDKIERKDDNWDKHLIKIAEIFYSLDGKPYDRSLISRQFKVMKPVGDDQFWNSYIEYDKFDAYGTYLGIFRFEQVNGVWTIVVSEAAKQFLCTKNPNPAAFCRAQLALFQYPNGIGAAISEDGSIFVQKGAKTNTMRELREGIHLNVFRLLCRITVALHEYEGKELREILLPYDALFCMVNDPRINQSYSPDYQTILLVWSEYTPYGFGYPVKMNGLNNFKRNFHIIEKTGLFIRNSHSGCLIPNIEDNAVFGCIKAVAEMKTSFDGFYTQFGQPDEKAVETVITDLKWGRYYDACWLPPKTLNALSVKVATHSSMARTSAQSGGAERATGGENIILYGVPGSGKSWIIEHEYCEDRTRMERLVFHPDYMYSDFIGQILPVVREDKIRYEFLPGPFTRLLRKAYHDPTHHYYLIIEEINRGNASAIFGDVFQLLDRITGPGQEFPIGTSEYEITNSNIAQIVYEDPERKVRIPSNFSIIATMNTSDQNVFTIDTAFQRRWTMRMVQNSFESHCFSNHSILDTTVSWKAFCYAINNEVLRRNNATSFDDRRLGVYFITVEDLEWHAEEDTLEDHTSHAWVNTRQKNARFAEKVLKYLWDDAFKFSRSEVFNTKTFKSLELVIAHFCNARGNARFGVFSENMFDQIMDEAQVYPVDNVPIQSVQGNTGDREDCTTIKR